MKTTLILAVILCGSVWGAEKKVDLRQGTKAVDEKYLESMTSEEPARKTISHDVHANQSRAQQIEAKKDRQYQEERPYPGTKDQLEKLDDQQ